MSVASEFAPEVYIPSRARRPRERHLQVVPGQRALGRPGAGAGHGVEPAPWSVVTTHVGASRPSRQMEAAPLRLTRRGVAAIAAAAAVVGAALLAMAWWSAPAAPARAEVPAVVQVQPGDTLWSIAGRIAPDHDPRAEVADLQRLNGLGGGVELQPGQSLRTR